MPACPDAILEAVTKAGNVVLDRAMEMVPSGIEGSVLRRARSRGNVDFATSNDMDLIVMGSRGLGVVKGVLLGSVSQYIVEQSKCPVLVAVSKFSLVFFRGNEPSAIDVHCSAQQLKLPWKSMADFLGQGRTAKRCT